MKEDECKYKGRIILLLKVIENEQVISKEQNCLIKKWRAHKLKGNSNDIKIIIRKDMLYGWKTTKRMPFMNNVLNVLRFLIKYKLYVEYQ